MQGGVAEPRRFEFARRFSPHFARYGNSGSCIPAHSTLIPQRSTQLVRLITCHLSLVTGRVTRNSPPGAPPDPFLISRFPHYLMDSGSCIPAHSTLIPQRSTQLVRLITCHLSLVTSERYSIAIFPPPLSNRTRFNARLPWRTSPLPFRRPAIPLRECGLSLLIFPS